MLAGASATAERTFFARIRCLRLDTGKIDRLLRIFLNGPPLDIWDPKHVIKFLCDRRCLGGGSRGKGKKKKDEDAEDVVDTSEIWSAIVDRFTSQWNKWNAFVTHGASKMKKRKEIVGASVRKKKKVAKGVDMGVGPDCGKNNPKSVDMGV